MPTVHSAVLVTPRTTPESIYLSITASKLEQGFI